MSFFQEKQFLIISYSSILLPWGTILNFKMFNYVRFERLKVYVIFSREVFFQLKMLPLLSLLLVMTTHPRVESGI